jgi:hypothetical protein
MKKKKTIWSVLTEFGMNTIRRILTGITINYSDCQKICNNKLL